MSDSASSEGGFTPSSGFLESIQRITALNVFARAFPVWTARHGKTASLSFSATMDGGVEINLSMPPGSTPEEADDLLDLIEQCQRMADLEAIVSEMKASGQKEEVVQNYIIEAEAIAMRLFPR